MNTHKLIQKKLMPAKGLGLVLAIGLILSVFSLFLACITGPIQIQLSFLDFLNMLALKINNLELETNSHFVVIWELRLARAVLSFSAGAALALAGLVLQSILQNPLADPFTLGIASGAAFGAALALVLGLPPILYLFSLGLPVLSFCALLGALLALALVLFIAASAGSSFNSLRPETLVLAGVVCSSFLAALISLVKALNEDSVASIVFWIMGSFQGKGWQEFHLFLPLLFLGLAPVILLRRALDVLCLGQVQAEQLGLNAGQSRFWLMLGAGSLAAGAVAVSGIIGFVGLLVPHFGRILFARLAWSTAPSNLILFSAFGGGLLLLWSDLLARRILSLISSLGLNSLSSAELPVGVITALIGAPVFCLLLRRQLKFTGRS